jgi:hypothetical protein
MYFHAPDNAKLIETFEKVGESLSQLRVVR